MDQEQFIRALEDELRAYIDRLDFNAIDTAEIIEESKRIVRMSRVLDTLREGGVEQSDIEYLTLSPTPLKDIADNLETHESVSIDYDDLGLEHYGPYEEIQNIIENDLFKDDQKESTEERHVPASKQPPDVGDTKENDVITDRLIDEMSMGDFFNKVNADYRVFRENWQKRWDAAHPNIIVKGYNPNIGKGIGLIYEDGHMASIYQKLMNPEDHFSPEEIAYLAKDPHPLNSVCGYLESLYLGDEEEKSTPELAVYTMVQEDYLNLYGKREKDDLEKLAEPVTVHFLRKEPTLQDIKDYRFTGRSALFKVRKEIVLSPAMYRIFSKYLLGEFSFVKENRDTRLCENKEWDCLLVHSTTGNEAALIAAEGYEYARYAAYLSDYTVLNLNGVPRDVRTAQSEALDIKYIIAERQQDMDVVEMQQLMCSLGEVLESGCLPDQQYLFNNTLSCYAGFFAERTDVTDINGKPLHIGDTVDMINRTDRTQNFQIVWQDPSGQIVPSQKYITSRYLAKRSDWRDSIQFVEAMDFKVYSCKDDYHRAQDISRQMTIRSHERNGHNVQREK